MVADEPACKIAQKVFHNEIVNDNALIKEQEHGSIEIPNIRGMDEETIQVNYFQIKQDIQEIIVSELPPEDNQIIENLEKKASGSSLMRPMQL
jgi:patatin-like phospholipase/acyl hydrolase